MARLQRHPWIRRSRSFLHLAICFGLITVSIFFADTFVRNEKGVNLLWFPNAILLSYLLLAPRWRWPLYIGTAFLSLAIGSAMIHEPWRVNLLFNMLDLGEAVGAALLLRRRSATLPRFIDPRFLTQFVLVAVVLMPVTMGSIFTLVAMFWLHRPPIYTLFHWVASDGLGMAVVTPTFVAILRTPLRRIVHWRGDMIYLLVLGLVTCGAFTDWGVLLIFLIYPLLVVAVLRTDSGWGAVCIALVAVLACAFTVNGYGPFVHSPTPSVMLQVFIAAAVIMVYSVSAITENLRTTDRQLKEIAALHELVTENSRDVIILADFAGRRNYVSASAATWGGWSREELLGHRSMDIVHPADKSMAVALVDGLLAGGSGGLLECRVQKKNGDYAWVEANIRPVRNPTTHVVTGVLNMMRDIGERKAAEQELRNAYRALEALSVTDSLTQLANRRRFDSYLASEWRRGLRDQLPISILLIDVDLFKLYNDAYGHLRGDGCLKRVAEAVQNAVTRPGDLVARFGGEEFAVVLPNTSNEGAIGVADEVCAAMRLQAIAHNGNPPGYVTVSIGCATMVPAAGRHPAALIQKADDALYAAKRAGRNRICNGSIAKEEIKQAVQAS